MVTLRFCSNFFPWSWRYPIRQRWFSVYSIYRDSRESVAAVRGFDRDYRECETLLMSCRLSLAETSLRPVLAFQYRIDFKIFTCSIHLGLQIGDELLIRQQDALQMLDSTTTVGQIRIPCCQRSFVHLRRSGVLPDSRAQLLDVRLLFCYRALCGVDTVSCLLQVLLQGGDFLTK